MARTNIVKKAKKDHGNCRACGKAILKGDSYKYAEPRYGPKVIVCSSCTITPSMTSSSKMVAVWEAQEAVDKADIEGLADAVRDLASTAREAEDAGHLNCLTAADIVSMAEMGLPPPLQPKP